MVNESVGGFSLRTMTVQIDKEEVPTRKTETSVNRTDARACAHTQPSPSPHTDINSTG